MLTNMKWELVFITKEIADKMLLHNHLNRPVKQKIEKLKADLIHGCFQLTHQGIAIAEDNELVDGQHRLIAISETGIPAWMWVCYNAPKSTKIDKGVMRTDRESLYMAGIIEKGTVAWNNLTFPLITFIIKRNIGTGALRSITEDCKYNVYLKYQNIIDPVICMAAKHQVASRARSAIVLYGMLCALNSGINIEKLKRWYSILSTGDFYSENQSELIAGRGILILKKVLDNNAVLSAHGNIEKENDLLGKIETSILHFSNDKPVKQIKGAIVFKEITIHESDIYKR